MQEGLLLLMLLRGREGLLMFSYKEVFVVFQYIITIELRVILQNYNF